MKVLRGMMYIAAVLCILVPALCRPVAAQQRMNLTDCLEHALQHNPGLKAARYGIEASEKNAIAVHGDGLPSLSASLSSSDIDSLSSRGPTDVDYLEQTSRNFTVQLSQTLYAGFRLVNAEKRARIETKKAIADKNLAALELIYNIQIQFFELMKAKGDLEVAQESVARLEEGVRAAKAYFVRELISRAEVLTARVDLADAKEKLGIARNDVNRKRISLFSFMNMEVTDSVVFDGGMDFFDEDYASDLSRCWQIARENRPDLESLHNQMAMAKKDAEIALGKYAPVVEVNATYRDQEIDYNDKATSAAGEFDRDQRSRYVSAGITINWELFDGGRAFYERQKSNVLARKVEQQIQQTRLQIKEGIRKALFSITEAESRSIAAKTAVAAAQENYQVFKRQLEEGLATVPDLLDAQIRLTRAQGNQTRAIIDYMLGRAELQFMMGERSQLPQQLSENNTRRGPKDFKRVKAAEPNIGYFEK